MAAVLLVLVIILAVFIYVIIMRASLRGWGRGAQVVRNFQTGKFNPPPPTTAMDRAAQRAQGYAPGTVCSWCGKPPGALIHDFPAVSSCHGFETKRTRG